MSLYEHAAARGGAFDLETDAYAELLRSEGSESRPEDR
jgi:hypothetical protein